MSVPKYDDMMLPVLKHLAEIHPDEVASSGDLRNFIVDYYCLSQEDQAETIPSGLARYMNNVQWACTYLKQAGCIESPKRGTFRILERGKTLFNSGVEKIDRQVLMQYPEFEEFQGRGRKPKQLNSADMAGGAHESDSPEEIIDDAFHSLDSALVSELLEAIMQQSPEFFERLVVELLLAMGYGDSIDESGLVTPLTNDGGIDGVIREDKLGFDSIYIQAKRWALNTSVGRPDVQSFVGALTGTGASKGLFITTARFSKGAQEFAKAQHTVKLVLVDGDQLARLMIAHNVGVSVRHTYEIKSLDRDYFDL